MQGPFRASPLPLCANAFESKTRMGRKRISQWLGTAEHATTVGPT